MFDHLCFLFSVLQSRRSTHRHSKPLAFLQLSKAFKSRHFYFEARCFYFQSRLAARSSFAPIAAFAPLMNQLAELFPEFHFKARLVRSLSLL